MVAHKRFVPSFPGTWLTLPRHSRGNGSFTIDLQMEKCSVFVRWIHSALRQRSGCLCSCVSRKKKKKILFRESVNHWLHHKHIMLNSPFDSRRTEKAGTDQRSPTPQQKQ